MWFGLVVSAAVAAPSECALTETDYATLRRELRSLRREAGRPIGVAAEGDRCERAVLDLLRNDPFLPVELVPRSTLEMALSGAPDRCGAIVSPPADGTGYELQALGACDGVVEAGSRSLFTLAYWAPVGASMRYNKHLGLGISMLFDAAFGVHDADDPTANPDEILAENVVRGLVGFDLAKRPGLRGAYVGLRGGAEGHVADDALDLQTGLVEFVVGRKWIATHGLTLQVAGGIAARIPLGNGPMPEELVPIAELRVGLANRE